MLCSKYRFRFSVLLFAMFLLFMCFLINSCKTPAIIDNVTSSPLSTTPLPDSSHWGPTSSPSTTPGPTTTQTPEFIPSLTPEPTLEVLVTASPEIITPEPTTSTARVIMVGDMLMHDGVINSGKNDSGYNFDHLFTNILSEINSADLAIVNQEVIIAGPEYGIDGYPRFNSPLELANSIVKAGFDVVLNASNHTLDKGKDAMLFSLSYWRNTFPEVNAIGMHDSVQDANKIIIREVNGIKFAFLNFTYGVNNSGKEIIAQEPYLVDILEETRVRSDIARAEAMADITIMTVHWGTEYTHIPSKSQKNWANIFLECGVDLVLGTHPHVIQPVEWLERDDGHRMLVYWSLGNFVNCTSGRGTGKGARMLGAMSDVTFIKDKNGVTTIENAVAHSLITHIDYSQYGITTYFFDDYTESMFDNNQAKTFDSVFSYQYCIDTFDSILGAFLAQ